MGEYIAELVGFLIIAFVLWRWIIPIISRMMTKRQDAIRAQLNEAEEARKRLATAQQEYDEMLAEARRDAERVRANAETQSAAILAEMREQAQADAQRIVEQAHQQIEADHQQAFNELQATVGRLTADLTGRLVSESLKDRARQGRVIDRLLDGIEERVRAEAS